MLSEITLTDQDVLGMLEAVFTYNRKGSVIGLQFFDPKGTALTFGYMKVITDDKGLAVRSAPEADEAGVLSLERQLNPPVQDPRKVPPAASVAALESLASKV